MYYFSFSSKYHLNIYQNQGYPLNHISTYWYTEYIEYDFIYSSNVLPDMISQLVFTFVKPHECGIYGNIKLYLIYNLYSSHQNLGDWEFLTPILTVKLLKTSVLGKGPGETKITAWSLYSQLYSGLVARDWVESIFFSLKYTGGNVYIQISFLCPWDSRNEFKEFVQVAASEIIFVIVVEMTSSSFVMLHQSIPVFA